MSHKFVVGQMVELEPMKYRASTPGSYEIRFLLPASDRNHGDPSYRIRAFPTIMNVSRLKASSRFNNRFCVEPAPEQEREGEPDE